MGDLGSPDKRPCFYRIMWCVNTIDLRIPRAFEHHLLNVEADMVTLRSPCGNWDVKLVREEGYMYFREGWKEFVEHLSLGKKEFLLFNYNGDLSFDVMIFDTNLREKEYPSGGATSTHQNSCPYSFTSSFPFFRYSVKDYSVGPKSTLQIPLDFSRRHLPKTRQKFILRNLKGICWTVSIIITSSTNLAFSGGWKAFADDNLIKKGDVCIFELVEKNTMQVHVFR